MKHFDFIVLDTVLLILSFSLAYFIRHSSFRLFHYVVYRESAMLIILTGFLGSILMSVHKNILKRGYWQEIRNDFKLSGACVVVLLAYLFFFRRSTSYSRILLIWFFILSPFILFCGNRLWRKWLISSAGTNLFAQNKMLVLAHSRSAVSALRSMKKNSLGRYDILGLVLLDDAYEVGYMIEGVPVISKYSDIAGYMQQKWVDEVMIWLPRNIVVPNDILDLCVEMGITSHIKLYVDSDRPCQHTIEKYAGATVLTESLRIASNRQIFTKRAIDIVGSIIGLAITGILTIIVGPIIYLTDPGPIFFSQKRVGENGRIFKIYKFRSMYKDAEKRKAELMDKNKMKGLMFKMDADPRILGSGPDGTRHGIGWFIRKTSIDEFPQFWNVFLGQMSMVGTRPPTLDEWEKYDKHHRARMAVKPGLTGMWQVSGRSDIQDFEEVIKLDLEYINNWDIGMDIKLILKTIKVVLLGRGAE